MSITNLPFQIVSKLDIGPGCWRWSGFHDANGYPRVAQKYGSSILLHIVLYEAEFGPVPDGLELDHVRTICVDGPSCPNPWHLEAVTHRENVLRGVGPSAINARKTHCIRGHEFTPENTYHPTPTSRHCRICLREIKARYKTKIRGKPPAIHGRDQTHCIHSHEFTPENTYLWDGRMRQCRQCGRDRYERTKKK